MIDTEPTAAVETTAAKPRQKVRGLKKALAITGFSLLGLIVAIIIAVAVLFGGEINTLLTVSKVGDTDLFLMEYRGDYAFDAFLEQGAANDAAVVSFVSKRLLSGLPLNFDLPQLGCSTFLATTPNNEYIFGRNFDNLYTPVLLLTTRPAGGYASISVVNLSFIGYSDTFMPISLTDRFLTLAAPFAPLDGVNEKGLSIGVLQLSIEPTVQDTGKINITTTTAIRLVLDKAASVDEALDLLQQYDMRSSAGAAYHFQISDAYGKSVVLVYVDNEFTVLDLDCATNFVLAPGEWYNHGGGQDRYEVLVAKLEESGGILTEQQGMELLSAVQQPGGSRSPTQWSILYNNTKQTAKFCLRGDFSNVYEFSVR